MIVTEGCTHGLNTAIAKSGAKTVQITIDDAPGKSNSHMIALLAKYQIKTMFFVEGEFVKARKDDVRALVRNGHKLGLHTWNHPHLTKLSDDQIKDQFIRTDRLVKELTNTSMAPNWRPPYGNSDARVERVVSSIGFTKKWLWDVDSLDWKHKGNSKAIIDDVENGLAKCRKTRCIVLFHDHEATIRALELLLPRLMAQGLTLADFP